MSQAMQLIVDGYVKLGGRKALEDLKEHRGRLATELRSLNSVLDLSSTVGHFEREIAIIDDGLARLKNMRLRLPADFEGFLPAWRFAITSSPSARSRPGGGGASGRP
jgi:hypothetical protein